MKTHKIRIGLPGASYGTIVEVDGKKIDRVAAVSVSHSVGELPFVKLTLVGYDIEIEGEAPVTVEHDL